MTSPRPRQTRIAMGPGGEFDLIRRLLGPEAELRDGVLVGPGDDCTVLEGGVVVSADLAVEGVHFRREWVTLEEAGYRATAAALSDLAAMAAEPLGALLSMAIGRSGGSASPASSALDPSGGSRGANDPSELAAALQRGAEDACRREGIALLGGDLARSPGPLMLNVVVLGRTDSPILRRGSEAGDEVWVTGVLGGSSAAVAAWNAGRAPTPELREAFARPRPRIQEALWLKDRIPIHGLIDLSDGLAGDAGHLAAASGLSLVLRERAIPNHPAVTQELSPGTFPGASPGQGDNGGPTPLHFSLEGGEDFELCFTAPPESVDDWAGSFQENFGLPLTKVGWVREGKGLYLETLSGGFRPLKGRGFSHFSQEEIG